MISAVYVLALAAVASAVNYSPPSLIIASGSSPRERSCLVADANVNQGGVSAVPCISTSTAFPSGSSTFVVPLVPDSGAIKTFDGAKCLDVTDGDSTNGNRVQLWDCVEGNTNQNFTRVEAPSHPSDGFFVWNGQNKCLDIRDGNYVSGVLQIWDCQFDESSPQQLFQISTIN
ncbi:hypothetical protein L218DRAFT_991216 [Marasmius fiardii PR-910]|nr:hypothetical protein L218DRAFT_991216 [Marasmius fiardii PR-910]